MSIIQFKQRKKTNETSLNDLLKIAVDLKRNVETNNGAISNFKALVSGTFMDILIKNRMIEKESIICGMYISEILNSIYKTEPEHWIASDYMFEALENDDPLATQRGANVCFLICSLFPSRKGRCMRIKDYEIFGVSMYLQFYHQTGKEIGFYMSKQFNEMTEVTKECIEKI